MTGKRTEFIKNILSVAVVLIAAALLLLTFTGNMIYVVKSGSMEPAIRTGAAAFVNGHAKYENVQDGEIICFTAMNGTDVIHRAVTITPGGIETKGDANSVSDGALVTESNYKGKVFLSIPYAGYALAAAASRKGKILIVTAAVCVIVLSWMSGKNTKDRREDVKKNTV